MFSKSMFAAAIALATIGACKETRNEADNTAKNARDERAVPTADKAVNNSTDLELTKRIRQSVMDDGTLSTNAQNSKIIVQDGKVTLAGPVASDQERARVAELAASVVGNTNVINQLEVTK